MASEDKKNIKTKTSVKGDKTTHGKNKPLKKVRLFSQVNINVPLPRELALILPSLSVNATKEQAVTNDDDVDSTANVIASVPSQKTSQQNEQNSASENVSVQFETKAHTPTEESTDSSSATHGTIAHSSHYLSTKLHPIINHIAAPANHLEQSKAPAFTDKKANQYGGHPNPGSNRPEKLIPETEHTTDKTDIDEKLPQKTPLPSNGAHTSETMTPDVKNPPEHSNGEGKSRPTGTHQESKKHDLGKTVSEPKQPLTDPKTSEKSHEHQTQPHPTTTYIDETIKGKFGSLHVDTSGKYTFTLDPKSPAYILLQKQEPGTDTFTLHLSNGSTSVIHIPVQGKQDTPSISGNLQGLVTEDHLVNSAGLISTSGKIDVIDPDHSESSVQAETIQGQFGTLTINSKGQWQYQVDNSQSNIQALTQSTALHETFTIHAKDGTPQVLNMTIGGENDKAIISGVGDGTIVEDQTTHVQGQLLVTDADLGEDHFQASQVIGVLGTLTITKDGAWSYDLDNANPKVQALGQGSTATDTITVTSADGTQHQITITVNGNNDTAVIAGTDSGSVTEESQLQTSGTLTVTDVDTGEAHFSNTDVVGTLGTLHLQDNGAWTYDLDNTNPKVQALAQGTTATDTMTVHSADGTPYQVTITVNGTNDTAVISGTDSGSVTEESQLQASGTLTVTDVDTGEAHFSNTDVIGTLGTLHLQGNGAWTYDLDNTNPKVQALAQGTTATDTMTVHSADGTPHQVTITVNGTNDTAVIAGTDTGSVTEESQLQASGTLTVTDVDTGEAHFSNSDVIGTLGTMHLQDNGTWTYDLDNTNPKVQALAQGATATDTITVHSADGTPHQVTITVNGTNDTAVISGTDFGSVTEESQLQTSGTLTVTDVDTGEAHFSNTDVIGTLGTLHLQDNGAWTYALDNTNPKVQALAQGATATDTMLVHSADGTPHQVTITVNGTKDTAVISGTDFGSVTEESQLQTSGTLNVSDVDTGEEHFSDVDVIGTFGTLHLKDNGAWTYNLDNTNPKVQALAQGGAATDTISVMSVDGTPHQVTITVNGTNDRPVVSGTSTGAVVEQGLNTTGTPDANGSLTATDIDTFDTITWAVNQPQGHFGVLSIDQQGHWHYQLDNSTGSATDKLAAGEHQSESFWITATDSAGATVPHKIVIDVQGSNDKPIVSAWTQLPAGKEDQPVTIKASDLLTHATDVDSSDILHVTNLQATHGRLTDNQDGTYSFTPDKDFNGEIRLTYDVTDGHGGSVSTQAKFDLTAAPDNAQIGYAATDNHQGGVTEDRYYIDTHDNLHFNGKLDIVDPDKGEAQFDINLGPQTYQGIGYDTKLGGHVLIMQDGRYTYTIRDHQPLVQNLKQGETITDECIVRSQDGTPFTIKVSIHGTNDAPSLTAQHHSVTEDSSLLSGQMVGHDIDHDATLTYSIAKPIDGLTFNADGSYSFDPTNASYQHLSKGQTETLTAPVTVIDEHGASETQNLEIVITGTNDAATIAGVDTGNVHENQAGQNMSPDYAQPGMSKISHDGLMTSGQLSVIDPDSGEAKFDTKSGVYSYHGQYGHLLLRENGHWDYKVAAGQTDWLRQGASTTVGTTIDKLGLGETLTDTITVQSKDGTTHDIVITIHGDNDAPYVSGEVQLNSGKEDLPQTLTQTELLANSIDVDHNDLGKLSIANLHANHGSILDNKDGSYTFTPDKDYNGQVHFTYDVKDAHGGTTHTGANTTLVATPDKAIISEVTTGSVIEDGPHATHSNGTTTELASGQLHVIDPDSGESKFQYSQFGETRIHDPFGGMLRIDSAGSWGYSVDNAALQHLAQGQVETVTYRVHSFDGTAYDLHIDIIGTNDAPTVSKVVLSNGMEDTHYQMQASQFGFTDVDTGDTLHSMAITDLPPATQGKFVLDGHDITAGQSILAADIAKLQFIPTPDFNGDVQFKFTVNDGHVDSQEATNTLHIDAVGDAATISGRDTGDVHEGHTYTAPDGSVSGGYVDDRSPDNMHGNVGKIWNDEIHTDGHLDIVDPDSGESHAKTGTYQGTHGHVILQSNGDWSYYASIGQDATGRRIDRLGQGESITDTVTVKSADGTTHDIHITIHGDNDRPYCSSEVQLNSGKEDLAQTITTTELLANTVDVDTNDAGQLSIANLRADHGTLVDHKDGTFTFTPARNYNGQVHFTYDVKDAHGGVTHTGASTTLLPSNDAATLPTAQAANFVTEDHLKSGTHTNELWSGWKNLDIQDIDSPSEAKVTQIEVNGVKHTVPADFAMNLSGAHGTFNFTHSTDGHNKWSYSADNTHAETQRLSSGESLTDTITLITADGTRIPLTAKILGTDDHVVIDTPDALTAALGTAVEDKITSISGSLLAHDSDSKDSVTFTAGDSVGSYGTLHVDSNGQWHYDLDHSKANALQQGETKAEGFDITATSTDGSTATKHIEVLVRGSNDKATITVVSNPDVHEDGSSTPVEVISGQLSVVDPDHGQSEFSTDVGKRHDPFNSGVHGGLHISKDGSWTYSVNNSQIQQLTAGQEEHIQYNVHTIGGDTHVIDIKIVGTNDDPVLSVTQTTPTTGTLTETDVDVNDTHTFSVVSSTGQFGSLSLDPDSGAYAYIANGSVAGMSYNSATQTYHGIDVFEVKVADNHGGESTRFMTFDTNGQVSVIPGQQPTVSTSVPVNPLITATQPSLPAGTNTPPSNAVTVDLATPSDTGASNSDNLTKDSTPTITGQTDIPYSQVTIYEGSKPVGHTVSDGSGHYSVTVTSLADGNHNLSALALAPAAAVPVTSPPLSVHIDTTITPLQISLTQDTGSNTSDLITSDGSLTITGQEVGALIEYSTDNGHTWTSSFTPQQGSNTVSVRQTDVAGNVSTSSSLTFTLDNSSAAPTVTLATDSGSYSSDNITNIGDLNIGGIEQGATVEYSVDHGIHWSTQFTPMEGMNTVQVRQTDVAGNVSTSTSLTYKLDTSASATGDTNTAVEDTTTQLSGNVLANDLDAQSVISTGDIQGQYGLFHLNSDGSYTYTLNNNLASVQQLSSGSKPLVDTIGYTAQDSAGNQASAQLSISIQGTDEPQQPPTTLVKPAQITGGAGHQDLHASLGIPPQHNTGTTQHHGWGILTGGGSVVTSLHGQFGTLHVDPNTGHLDYDYSTSSGVIKTHTGGSYGSGTDETDSFILTLDGSRDSQVAVHLHLHSQSIHGHSGHHIDMTTLTGIDVSPLSPPPPPPVLSQSDEVADVDTLDVDITLPANTEDDQHYVSQYNTSHQTSHADISDSSHGAAAYLSALGIEATQTTHDTSAHAALPDDIDIIFADTEEPIDNSPLAPDGTEGSVHEDEHQDDKHEDLINPDEHHDQDDPSSFVDPY